MLNNSELERLLGAMRVSRVTALEVKSKGQRLRLVLPVSATPTIQSVLSTTPMETMQGVMQLSVNSPTIGTFLRRGIDDGLPLLKAGMHVVTGDVLGYVCQGPVRIVIDAPASGVLDDDGPDDGAVLGLGDAVFNLDATP